MVIQWSNSEGKTLAFIWFTVWDERKTRQEIRLIIFFFRFFPLHQVHVLYLLGVPGLRSIFQSTVEGHNYLLWPALLLVQPRIWLSFRAASTQVLFLRAVLNPFSAQPVFVFGIAWPWCRTLHMDLLHFMRLTQTHHSSLSRSLWMVSRPSSVPAAPHSLVLLATYWGCTECHGTHVEQHWSQYWPPRNATCPLAQQAVDHKSLSGAITVTSLFSMCLSRVRLTGL